MAYPYGVYSDEVVDVLKSCGIAYSRTVESTEKFDIPMDWLRMPATCKHTNPRFMELADEFLHKDRAGKPSLFYLWGHSYEFEKDNNWNVIEEFAEYIGQKEDVWYATNIEVYDYVQAYERLIFSTVGKKVYNPSYQDVHFSVNGEVYCVKSGKTVCWE